MLIGKKMVATPSVPSQATGSVSGIRDSLPIELYTDPEGR